jgi:hypothetical protein
VIPQTIESLLLGVGMSLLALVGVLLPIWRGPTSMRPDDEEIEQRIAAAAPR